VDEVMQIETTISQSLRDMPPDEFIIILRPIFQADKIKVILVGVILGAASGAVEEFVIFRTCS
jgi:hypothetical protein